MLKLGRATKVKVHFLVLVFVFNFDLFKFSAAILEKGLLNRPQYEASGNNHRACGVYFPVPRTEVRCVKEARKGF